MKRGIIFAGRYEILAPLGRGGMGEVYRARHVGLDKEIALKVLQTGSKDFEARFEREARAAARLEHPNCIRVIDYGKTDRFHFIAMELIDGETLAQALASGPFTIVRALYVARGLLSALAHAHAHGVLHRDVKPENVILAGGRPVLIDFGLAVLEGHSRMTAKGMCVGSPSYVGPERLIGRPADARTDLYAVGVILYEMLAGARPFAGESAQDTMMRALQRPPRPLRSLRRDVPDELDAIIRCTLSKDPERRYVSAQAMLEALADVEVLDEDEAPPELARIDESSTTAIVTFRPAPWWRRLWSWLRYGGWRWARVEGLALKQLASTSVVRAVS